MTHQALRKDAVQSLDQLLGSLRRKVGGQGFVSLSLPEQTFYAVAVLRSDLSLGAFPLFFDSASDSLKRTIEAALTDLGRPELAEIVEQASLLWEEDAQWKADTDAETGGYPPNEARLTALTVRLLEEDADLAERLGRWALHRGLLRA